MKALTPVTPKKDMVIVYSFSYKWGNRFREVRKGQEDRNTDVKLPDGIMLRALEPDKPENMPLARFMAAKPWWSVWEHQFTQHDRGPGTLVVGSLNLEYGQQFKVLSVP